MCEKVNNRFGLSFRSLGCLLFGCKCGQFLLHLHRVALLDFDFTDDAVALGLHEVLHLHGLDRDKILALLHRLAWLDKYLYDAAGHRAYH